MDSSSDNIKFTPYRDTNGVIEKLFLSLRSKYEDNLETSIKGSNFKLDSVELIYCKFHEIHFKGGGSYIDSQDWIKRKKNNNKSKK